MERNTYGIDYSESEVLLPPRKRLLAGFKKQNADANGSAFSPSKQEASSSTSSAASSDVQTHLNNLIVSDLKNPNLTPEEIAESSRSAAVAAAKAAKAARAVADEKAAVAAEAVAAAKRALDLVFAFSNDEEKRLKKNHKMKKQVPIEIVYTKEDQRENDGANVELAHRLHRAINSSPRSLGNSSGSTPKSPKLYKKHKGLDTSGSSEHITGDEMNSPGRKTRRVRVKMLPLRSCDSRNDEEDDTRVAKSLELSTAHKKRKTLIDPEGSSKDFPTETWNCQGLKTPECIKQAVGS